MNRLILLTLLFLGLAASAGTLLSADEDGVHTKFDKNPVPVLTPPPQVPAEMKGQNGIVAVIVVIDASGAVEKATVSKSTSAALEQPSIDAIKKWKFKPAEVGGQAVKAKVTIPVRFSADS
jgi:protein TonB